MSQAVDKSKLRRSINKFEMEQISELEEKKPGGIWFDGKKDDTLHVIIDEQGKKTNVVIKEEHVSVICQPGGDYVTHLTPPGEKGVELGNTLTTFL